MIRVRLTGWLLAAPLLAASVCHAQELSALREGSEIRALPAGASMGSFVKERSFREQTLKPEAVQQQNLEYVVPELIIGGEWTSVIKLTNRGTAAIPTTVVFFYDNNGNPLTATFQTTSGNVVTGTGFSFSLPAGTMVEATFFGGSNAQFGHAEIGICNAAGVCSSSGLYVEVTLRNHNASRPDFESIFPLEEPVALQYMLWDYRNGLSETLYLVNVNQSSTTVFLDFRDTNNQLLTTVPVPMAALSSQLLTVHVIAPSVIGLQGTMVVRAQNSLGNIPKIAATALRINPSNSFTPMRSFIPAP
jgi:hypothetical protein